MTVSFPELPQELPEAGALDDLLRQARDAYDELDGLRFTGRSCDGLDFQKLSISHVLFEDCRFTGCTFVRGELVDVCFRNCDVSNCKFTDAYFSRVRFERTKAVGADFSRTVLKNLSVADSVFRYATLAGSKLNHAELSDSDFSEAALSECELKYTALGRVNLRRANCFKTSLKGQDLRTCNLEDILVSDTLQELRGAVVDVFQAAALAAKLGIVIR